MWCSTCQQDVPGLGSPGSGGELRCGKCGGSLAGNEHPTSSKQANSRISHSQPARPDENAAFEMLLRCPTLPEDDWTLEAELRGMERLVSSLKSRDTARTDYATESASLHLPQMAIPGWHAMPHLEPNTADDVESADPTPAQPRANTAAWAILSLSLAVFACGAVLLAWSLIGQREDLWPVGLPLALIGQAGLILGLVLRIEGLAGRRTTESRPPHRRRGHAQRAMALSASERELG